MILVGLPEKSPVVVLKIKPAGIVGETAYEAMRPPVDEIAYEVISL